MAMLRPMATANPDCGRVTNGQIYCWGYNAAGALGAGDNLTHWTPVLARP